MVATKLTKTDKIELIIEKLTVKLLTAFRIDANVTINIEIDLKVSYFYKKISANVSKNIEINVKLTKDGNSNND